MSIELNHTIIEAKDAETLARFYSEILGLSRPKPFGSFIVVETSNAVSLDFRTSKEKIISRHFAFLVSEREFDEIFGRMVKNHIKYWADPGCSKPQQINHNDGGRGCYFFDPDGHILEIITRPYGSLEA